MKNGIKGDRVIQTIHFSFDGENDDCECQLSKYKATIIDDKGDVFDVPFPCPMAKVFSFKNGLIFQRGNDTLSKSVSDEFEDPMYVSLVNPLEDLKPISHESLITVNGNPVQSDFLTDNGEFICSINTQFSLVLSYNIKTRYYTLWTLKYIKNTEMSEFKTNSSLLEDTNLITSEVYFDFLWHGTFNTVNYSILSKYYFIDDINNNIYLYIQHNDNNASIFILPLMRSTQILSIQPLSNMPLICATIIHKYSEKIANDKKENKEIINIIENKLKELCNIKNYNTNDYIINKIIYSLYDILANDIALIIHMDILNLLYNNNNNNKNYTEWDIFQCYILKILNCKIINKNIKSNINEFERMNYYENNYYNNNTINCIFYEILTSKNIKLILNNNKSTSFIKLYFDSIFLSLHYISEDFYIQLNYQNEYNRITDFLQILSLSIDNLNYSNYYQRKSNHIIEKAVYIYYYYYIT